MSTSGSDEWGRDFCRLESNVVEYGDEHPDKCILYPEGQSGGHHGRYVVARGDAFVELGEME